MTNPAPLAHRLGCATNYSAYIYYFDRAEGQLRLYTELTGIIEITWERVLDDFSEARLRFRPEKGDDCCGKIKMILDDLGRVLEPGLWVWAHELAIYRDGDLVWQGPLFSIDELVLPDETSDHIQLTARDFIGWLDRRVIHNDIIMTDRTYDLSEMAERVVRDAFAPDPVGVLPHLHVTPSGRTGKRSVRHWEARSSEELRDIARGGLDFTSVGRAIIIKGPTRDETVPTTVLRAKDFNSGVEIRMVGSEAATVGYAIGAVETDPNSTQPIENIPPKKQRWPVNPAEGVNPFYGLIENWTQSEGVQDDEFLQWIARQKVIDGNPPPRTLSIPADTGLSPNAPVSIHHLIPSTYFTVAISGTCFALTQYVRLSHVRVSWTANQPETVGVTFVPGNILDDSGPPELEAATIHPQQRSEAREAV